MSATHSSKSKTVETAVVNATRGFDSQGNALPKSAITENELPPGWRWVRVNEIGEVKLGRQRAPKHQNGANMRPYLRVANVFEDRLDLSDVLTMNFTPKEFETFALRANDILLNEGQSLHLVGRPAMYRDDLPGACFQNTLVRFRPGPEVNPKFALTIFRGYMHTGKFQKIARWTTNIAHLGAQRFAEMPFPLPPLPEQRRIVAEIEKQFTRLEAGVAALRRVQANLKRYRAAVLKAACEGRLVPTEAELQKSAGRGQKAEAKFESGAELLARILTERRQNWLAHRSLGEGGQGRGQYKEPAAPDTANLPPLPEGWTWASLEQLSLSSSYGTSAKCNYENSGPPVLRIPNISSGRIDLADLKFAGASETIVQGEELRPGDLIIIRTNGSRSLIGRSAVVREKLDRPTDYASYLIRFRLIQEPIVFGWVGAIWDCSFLRTWIEQRAATSAGQHKISMSVLATLPVPLPPLAEQTRIVAEVERRLSVVEELELVVTANLQRATRLRQSILQKAFTGELT